MLSEVKYHDRRAGQESLCPGQQQEEWDYNFSGTVSKSPTMSQQTESNATQPAADRHGHLSLQSPTGEACVMDSAPERHAVDVRHEEARRLGFTLEGPMKSSWPTSGK